MIGKRPSVKGWKKKGQKSWICARRGGRIGEPKGRGKRRRKKKPKVKKRDRGGRASGVGLICIMAGLSPMREAVKSRHQSLQLSLPPAQTRCRLKISSIPAETTNKTC